MRALAREGAGVAFALQDRQERQEQQERSLVRRAQAAHDQNLTAKRIKEDIDAAKKELRQKRRAVQELEQVREAAHAMKTVSPEMLGQGQKKAGGARAQKVRFEVLDRLAVAGVGLSPEQRNDWAWFRAAWDAKMVSEHDKEWPALFAAWIQQVLEELASEAGSNAFSRFVHSETLRCLSDQASLRLPALKGHDRH